MKQILIFAFLMFVHWSYGQISFYKQFSNNGYDYGQGIVQLEDSSYVITGSSSSFLDAPSQMFLLKIDSMGNFIWSKSYGGNQIDWGRRVMYIENEGFLVAGYTNSEGEGAYDFALWKTDENGNEEWFETYGSESWERVLDAALTRDSGVIMVGETLNTVDGLSDILIVRTDKNGTELWREQYGSIGEDVITTIEKFDDSTFILAGKTFVADSGFCKALMFKMHENGSIEWSDTVGANGEYVINDISVSLINQHIAVVGMNLPPDEDEAIFEAKADANGQFYILNQAYFDGVDYYTGVAAFGSSDGYITTQALESEFSYGGEDIAISQNYAYLGWQNAVGGISYAGEDKLGQLITTNDQGAILVGYIEPTDVGGSNVFVMKVNPNQAYFGSNDDFTTSSLVSVIELSSAEDLKIYPNPTKNEFYLDLNSSEQYELVITDFAGRVVNRSQINGSEIISVDQLNSGSYFLNVTNINTGNQFRTVLLKN